MTKVKYSLTTRLKHHLGDCDVVQRRSHFGQGGTLTCVAHKCLPLLKHVNVVLTIPIQQPFFLIATSKYPHVSQIQLQSTIPSRGSHG